MKKILLCLFAFFACLWVQAQTLDHKLTPDLYLGADKEKLIEVATSRARYTYENNLDDVIDFQKRKGIKLKKKDALERFISAMEEDIESKLQATDNWNGDQVDLKNYYLSIEKLMGAGIELKGFDNIGTPLSAYASIDFEDDEVTSIYYTREVTSVLNPKRVIAFSDHNIQNVRNAMKNHYGACNGRSVEGKVHWNSDHAIYYSRDDYYKCEERIIGLFDEYKILLDVIIRYEPYGNESNYQYFYKGTCLSSITFHLRYQ